MRLREGAGVGSASGVELNTDREGADREGLEFSVSVIACGC
jgi:hypothetical protein